MDEVARRAGVSKATIYSHFESKQALFGAMITGRCTAMIPIIEAAALGDQKPEEALRTIGRQFLDLLMSQGPLCALPRRAVRSRPFPRAGPDLLRIGAEPGRPTPWPTTWRGSTSWACSKRPQPRVSAEQFFGMVLGQIHVRLMLRLEQRRARPGTSASRSWRSAVPDRS